MVWHDQKTFDVPHLVLETAFMDARDRQGTATLLRAVIGRRQFESIVVTRMIS